MRSDFPLLLVAALAVATSAVSADVASNAPATGETAAPKDRSEAPAAAPGQNRDEPMPPPDGVTSGRSLSDRLSEQKGVIRPRKGIDPEMVEPPPPMPSPMPVIPPPGTPGGAPGPVPK